MFSHSVPENHSDNLISIIQFANSIFYKYLENSAAAVLVFFLVSSYRDLCPHIKGTRLRT